MPTHPRGLKYRIGVGFHLGGCKCFSFLVQVGSTTRVYTIFGLSWVGEGPRCGLSRLLVMVGLILDERDKYVLVRDGFMDECR